MTNHQAISRLGTFRLLAAALLALAVTTPALAAAPTLQRAVSRRSHGGVNYDIPLPQSGGTGIESRTVAGGVSLVLTFDQPVTGGNAAVTAGSAALNGGPTFAGNTMTVNLTNVANAQAITVTLSGVTGTGGTLASANVNFRVLEGDVNSSGAVTASDVNSVKFYASAPVTAFNFRSDVNASGAITASDVNTVKLRAGLSIAGGSTANTPPTIAAVAGQTTTAGSPVTVNLTVGDAESDPATLGLIATSDNQTLLPDASIAPGGSGAARTLTLSPAAGQTGTANVTVTVGDGLATTTATFALTVSQASTGSTQLYVATMKPDTGVASSGSGSATLLLSADQTYATLKFSYTNLTSPKVSEHVHGPADPGVSAGILFDIDTTTPQADGSYKWVFVQTGATTAADQVAALKAGRTYINIHTSNYPAGEIRGQFAFTNGSQTFTPPAPPPSLPGGLPSQADAARFLNQATYGATLTDINDVASNGYENWLNRQFAMAQTSDYAQLQAWKAGGMNIYVDQLWSSWWKLANTAPDQLRQRVAFALSEIFVTSMRAATLDSQLFAMGNYYDLLGRDAFGNYRTLLEDVTLSPVMGRYLNMQGNVKANPGAGTNPNENYAREVNQLFSVGLYQLLPDGTLQLDANGQPIATYDQSVVQGYARVFTGWNYHQSGQDNAPAEDMFNPMTLIATLHEPGTKQILNGVVIPANQDGLTDLKQALDAIFNHPNVGPFFCKQLIQKLVTSNPSPGYVYRVAQVFNNNGSGVRGDLKAVVHAILTDYEARSSDMLAQQGFGKLREPLLRTTALQRGCHAYSVSNPQQWFINNTDFDLGQTFVYATTVFNFFTPGYVQPGQLSAAGLVAPEFQIINETTSMTVKNSFWWGIYSGFQYGDIKLDLSYQQSLAGDPSALVDNLNLVLCAGQMPAASKSIIVNYLNTISSGDTLGRARAAVYLVSTSSHFAVQR